MKSRFENGSLMLPDYARHCIANLAARLYGRTQPCAALQHPALDGLEDARTIILLIIDGMGCAQLDQHAPEGWFRRNQALTLTSVFPSTTTSAITTYLTGVPPSTHSMTGWHIAAPEVGGVATPLPLSMRTHSPVEPGQDELAASLYTSAPGMNQLDRHTVALQPHYIFDSPYSRHHAGHAERIGWKTYDDLFATLDDCLRSEQRQFIYAYIPDLDTLMHFKGTNDMRCKALVLDLEQRCAAFAAKLPPDAKLLICADHGQLDVRPGQMLFLHDFPELAAALRQPLSGEPRVAFCHIKPEYRHSFASLAEHYLGHAAWCIPSSVLLEEAWFGPGEAHPMLAARVGDFTLLMKDGWGLMDVIEGESPPEIIGNHGGLTLAEMQVPLIVAGGAAAG